MDLQTFLDNSVRAARAKTLESSDQLTLGELILKLEPIAEAQKGRSENKQEESKVVYDFEYLFPTKIGSWRGSYAELALNFVDSEHDKDAKQMKVTEFLSMLKDTVGKTFVGYKGGDFTMNKHTPVWVANYGNSGNTAVVEVVDNGYEVILMTAYREY